jgi:N-acetylglucosamine-6-phosphate deacetylase
LKLSNLWIVLEDQVVFGDLILDHNLISSIIPKKPSENEPKKYIVPGFIDLHIHGANGYDAMDSDPSAIELLACSLVNEGTTGFLPTTMTQSEVNTLKALSNISAYMKHQNPLASIVLGIHLEGPFIHEDAAGAQPINCIIKANTGIFKKFEKASNHQIKKVSIAPDFDESLSVMDYLKKQNIVISIAHTKATYPQVLRAIEHGASSITHMFNAMSALHHRDIGVVGAALLHDELQTELILDKIHVSLPAAKLLLKTKGVSGITLITDSMRAKYLGSGIYDLGGQSVHIKDGEARLSNGTLAGSILKMNDGYKYLVQDLGLSFVDASKISALNPAKQLGLDHLVGSIAPKKFANLVILDDQFTVLKTIINGQIVYGV